MSMRSSVWIQRWKQLRIFLIAVGATLLVWLCMSLSDVQTFDVDVNVRVEGLDTVRYAIVKADTSLTLNVSMNGFNAIRNRCGGEMPSVVVRVPKSHQTFPSVSIAVNDYLSDIGTQLYYTGLKGVASRQDSLRWQLAERCSKPFLPDISPIEFSFKEQFGLGGTPQVLPDTVWLYGSQESLNQINSIRTLSAHVSNIDSTSVHTFELNPAWKDYPDLRVSHTEVQVVVPVERYVERSFKLPVSYPDTSVRVRLYPEQVQVTCWVSTSHYKEINQSMITLSLQQNATEGTSQLPVIVTGFPSYARIKQVKPQTVECVIIR